MGGSAREGWLSSFMHLSGPSRVIKFLYAPAPLPPTVWALNLSRVLLCIKPTMHLWFIHPYACFGCVHIHNLGKWEGVGPLKSPVFGDSCRNDWKKRALYKPKNRKVCCRMRSEASSSVLRPESIPSHPPLYSPLCITTHMADCDWSEKASSHLLAITRDTRYRYREKSSVPKFIDPVYGHRSEVRTIWSILSILEQQKQMAEPQAKLSLLRSVAQKFDHVYTVQCTMR